MEEYFPKDVLDELGRAIQGASCLERTLIALTFAVLGSGGVIGGYFLADDIGMYLGGALGAFLALAISYLILRAGNAVRSRMPKKPIAAYNREQATKPVIGTPAPKFADHELGRIEDFFRGLDGNPDQGKK